MENIDDLIYNNDNNVEIGSENDTLVDAIPVKVKRIPNENQLRGLVIGRGVRDNNARIRKEKREIQAEENAKLYEERLIAQAVILRKKQIKAEYLLHMNAVDDIPESEINRMKQELLQKPKHQPPPQAQIPEHQFVFV